MDTHDLVIIGAGIAGLTAAAFAARQALDVLVIESTGAGGQVLNVEHIDNVPGIESAIAGFELGPLLQQQAEEAGAGFMLDRVESIGRDGPGFRLTLSGGEMRCKALIVAAGSSRRWLGVPGEERLRGRGVSQCASCDGPLFRGLRVCVVGGGDSALDEARLLASHAAHVTLVHRGAALDAQPALVQRLAGVSNIEVLTGTVVEEIRGDDRVDQVLLHALESGERRLLAVEGAFVYVGLDPNTAFLDGVAALDAERRIVTDAMLQSSVPGIFAAGDIRQGSVALLAAAAGDGATAAMAAARHVRALQG